MEPNRTTASAETSGDEYVWSVRDLLGVLRRRLVVILLVAVALAGAVVGYDLLQTPTYVASIKLVVGQEQTAETPSSLGSDVQGLQQLTQTAAEVLPTQVVADGVIEELDLRTKPEAFLSNMSVQQATQTQVIDVSYEDPDPERARLIANTIGDVFSDKVSELSPSANSITATVWQRASLPEAPVSPQPVRDGLVALLLGGMLGGGLAFLLEHLDDRWRSPEEVEQVSGLPTFGMIREFQQGKKGAKT